MTHAYYLVAVYLQRNPDESLNCDLEAEVRRGNQVGEKQEKLKCNASSYMRKLKIQISTEKELHERISYDTEMYCVAGLIRIKEYL